jgi:hypothetical protein
VTATVSKTPLRRLGGFEQVWMAQERQRVEPPVRQHGVDHRTVAAAHQCIDRTDQALLGGAVVPTVEAIEPTG